MKFALAWELCVIWTFAGPAFVQLSFMVESAQATRLEKSQGVAVCCVERQGDCLI